jgi:hypothetical protein
MPASLRFNTAGVQLRIAHDIERIIEAASRGLQARPYQPHYRE